MTARTFVLDRHEDPSGISGTGMVAEGIKFSDGTVALRWLGDTASTAVWDSVEKMLAAHGHGGKTVVRWIDPDSTIRRVIDVLESDAELRRYSHLDWHDDWEAGTGYHRLQVYGRELWLTWITALHGSPDGANAAVRVERRSDLMPFEWHWMTPDGELQVVYLEDTPQPEPEPKLDTEGESL